jgi:hypothetical protein
MARDPSAVFREACKFVGIDASARVVNGTVLRHAAAAAAPEGSTNATAPANAFVGRKEPMLDETRALLPWDGELEAMLRTCLTPTTTPVLRSPTLVGRRDHRQAGAAPRSGGRQAPILATSVGNDPLERAGV